METQEGYFVQILYSGNVEWTNAHISPYDESEHARWKAAELHEMDENVQTRIVYITCTVQVIE